MTLRRTMNLVKVGFEAWKLEGSFLRRNFPLGMQQLISKLEEKSSQGRKKKREKLTFEIPNSKRFRAHPETTILSTELERRMKTVIF